MHDMDKFQTHCAWREKYAADFTASDSSIIVGGGSTPTADPVVDDDRSKLRSFSPADMDQFNWA